MEILGLKAFVIKKTPKNILDFKNMKLSVIATFVVVEVCVFGKTASCLVQPLEKGVKNKNKK